MANVVEKSAASFESGIKSATTVRGEEVSNRIIFDGRNVEPLKMHTLDTCDDSLLIVGDCLFAEVAVPGCLPLALVGVS